MRFEILFVCTGNLCRSPMAERLFRARWKGAPFSAAITEVAVCSAGTRPVPGYAMDPTSATVLRELGGDPEGHVARRVEREMVNRAGLILTGDTTHRAQLVRENPSAMRRIFTLREFVRLGVDLGPPRPGPSGNRLARRVAEVADRRGLLEPPEDGADELRDPMGAPLPEVQRIGRQISDAVDGVIQILGLRP